MQTKDPARPGLRPGLLGRTGRVCYRHRWVTLASWVAAVACLVVLWMQFGAPADNNFTGQDPGQAILNQHFPQRSGDTLTLAIRSSAPVTSAPVRARVSAALASLGREPHVTAVTGPYTTPGQVARDGHIAFASVQFGVPSTGIPASEATALMNEARAASGHGVTFSLGGDVIDQAETPYGGSSDGIGIGAAAIVLLIAFGSFLAMGLPVLTAVFGIGSGLALIALLGHVFPAPSFSPIIASMIGLGVGVDYALFIVTRFREYLRAGVTPESATERAMGTAGRSVLTAGTTVVIGVLGLLVLRQPLMNGVAVAAAATVAMTVLAALTLLPALLGFTGTRLARPSRFRVPGLRRRPQKIKNVNNGAVPAAAGRPGCGGARRGGTVGGGAAGSGGNGRGRTAGRAASGGAVGRGDQPASGPGGAGRGGRHRGAGCAGAQPDAEHAGRVGPGRRDHGPGQLRDHGRRVRPRVRRAADRGRGRAGPGRRGRGAGAGGGGHAGRGPRDPAGGQPGRPGRHADRLPDHQRAGSGHQRAGQPAQRPGPARAPPRAPG